jgi:hypothetical protein
VRRLNVIVRESGALGTEQHCGRSAACLSDDPLGSVAYIDYAEILVTVTRSGRGDKPASIEAFRKRFDHTGTFEDVIRA